MLKNNLYILECHECIEPATSWTCHKHSRLNPQKTYIVGWCDKHSSKYSYQPKLSNCCYNGCGCYGYYVNSNERKVKTMSKNKRRKSSSLYSKVVKLLKKWFRYVR